MNLKCSGCENTVKKHLLEIEGVEDVKIELEEGSVLVEYHDAGTHELVIRLLKELGYPEISEENRLRDRARSFASCMIGRVSKPV